MDPCNWKQKLSGSAGCDIFREEHGIQNLLIGLEENTQEHAK
jgi:hypothetical protein